MMSPIWLFGLAFLAEARFAGGFDGEGGKIGSSLRLMRWKMGVEV